jgi:hypothetical protein
MEPLYRGRLAPLVASFPVLLCAATPAAAQSDGVQIYGFIKENVESIQISGNGRSQSLARLSNDLSVLGFRGGSRWEAATVPSSRSRRTCAWTAPAPRRSVTAILPLV